MAPGNSTEADFEASVDEVEMSCATAQEADIKNPVRNKLAANANRYFATAALSSVRQ